MLSFSSLSASQKALLVATAFGGGGLLLGGIIAQWSSSLCSSGFFVCMTEMIVCAGIGWLAGFYASLYSLKCTGLWLIASWLVLAWNAMGLLLCIGVIFSIAFY